ncbi:hypothetical protein [Legionella maioricensis]|uniref:Glycine-rich protein n=1 Tax=Legionella maioricensis TaxID=2896528 RepID=A0A9X2ID32_9GAMM|nr:hypothetical protein [Legionella maioricensis]MCL9684353.1 hypothetical protein [Legionella maioricensis]MCL9688781.1 hypothetical protein [Legionella maioricensis]
MKKIILSCVIASSTLGLSSCVTETVYSPGYNSNYVYSTASYPSYGYGNYYGVGWYGGRGWRHNNWYGARSWNTGWHGAGWRGTGWRNTAWRGGWHGGWHGGGGWHRR